MTEILNFLSMGISFFVIFQNKSVSGQCSLPDGDFLRESDSVTLTFTNNDLTGLNYILKANSAEMTPFICITNEGDKNVFDYRINDATGSIHYSICLQLGQLSSSAYSLFELTDLAVSVNGANDASFNDIPGVLKDASNGSPTVAEVCQKTPENVDFTIIVKSGASSSEVAVTCPTLLQNEYSIDEKCSGASKISFTEEATEARLDLTECNESAFGSSGGVLTCMGEVTQGVDTYLYLFDQSDNDIVCTKIEGTTDNPTITVYTDECKSVVLETLTLSVIPATTSTASTSATTSTPLTGSGSNTESTDISGSTTDSEGGTGTTATSSSNSDSGSSDDTAAIVGGTVGALAAAGTVVGLGVLYFLYKKSSIVNVVYTSKPGETTTNGLSVGATANGVTEGAKINEATEEMTVTEGTEVSKDATTISPAPDSTAFGHLPPIDTNGGTNVAEVAI